MDISLNIASVRAPLHRHEPPPLLTLPFVRSWCQPKHRTLSLRLRRSHKPPSLRYGRHLTKRVAPSRFSLSTTSLRFGGLTSRRRFASLRSGRRPSKGVILTGAITLRTFVTLVCNPALLKKISLPSSSFPCFVSRFLLCFPRLEIPPHPSLIRIRVKPQHLFSSSLRFMSLSLPLRFSMSLM